MKKAAKTEHPETSFRCNPIIAHKIGNRHFLQTQTTKQNKTIQHIKSLTVQSNTMSIFGKNQENTKQEDQQQKQKQKPPSSALAPHDQLEQQFEQAGATAAEKAKAAAQGAMDNIHEQNAETSQKLKEKSDNARAWAAEELDRLQHTLEPPKPEPPTLMERLGLSNKGTAVDKSTLNNKVSKDEQQPEDDKSYVVKAKDSVVGAAQEATNNIHEQNAETSKKLQEKSDNARLWTAEKVESLKESIAPENTKKEADDALQTKGGILGSVTGLFSSHKEQQDGRPERL